MVITYYGVEAFKVQFGDTVLAYNPVGKKASAKSPKFGADIALVSLADPLFDGVEQVSFGEKTPVVASGPGEYEVKGIFIKGFPSKSSFALKPAGSGAAIKPSGSGEPEKINTVYSVVMEDMHLCFLGALSDGGLGSEAINNIGEVDILFAPIGGADVLTPSQSYKLAVSLNAKIIIPMHYGEGVTALKPGGSDTADKDALKTFLKEAGSEKAEVLDKLTLKHKDLAGREGDVVVLSAVV